MRFLKTAVRHEEEIANDFAQLVEEGKALLGEMLNKPVRKATRDTMEQVSQKFSDYQTSAARIAQKGAKQGTRYAREADRYVHDNPWPVIAGGIAIGILASLWWSQRR